jgi:O-acetylserine/cysteine efflux transporter
VLINPLAIDWSSGRVIVGHVFLLGAGLSWSVAIIVTRAAKPNSSMFGLLPWCFLIGALVLAPTVWWHAPHGTLGHSPTSSWALGYIGIVAGPLGTWCVMEATAKLPTLVSSVGFLTTPAVSLILANVFLHEPFTPDLLAGSALIMAGVGVAAWPRRRNP